VRYILFILGSSALACGPRESANVTPAEKPEKPQDDARPARDARNQEDEHTRIDRDRLNLFDWKPVDDAVQVTWNGEVVYMDKTEVTVRAYRECVNEGVCSEPGPEAIALVLRADPRIAEIYREARHREVHPEGLCPLNQFNWAHPDREDHPVNCVTFWQAWRYCRFRGKRLPDQSEWYAAWSVTSDGSVPWGSGPISCKRAVLASPRHGRQKGCAEGHTMPVGSKPLGATSSGILDMVGNVAEMVVPDPIASEDGEVSSLASDWEVVTRGGSYAESAKEVEVFEFPHWGGREGTSKLPGATVGFRCVAYPPFNGRDYVRPTPDPDRSPHFRFR
jgi:formylglycine-generating enzyme required for sulfatase activity